MASSNVRYKAKDGTLVNLSTKVINNTTSDSTTDALSAAQGKILNNEKAASKVLKADTDLNTVKTPGIYSCGGGNSVKNKPSGLDAIGLIVIHNASGEFYTQIITTSTNTSTYRRSCVNGTWNAWTIDKYTDTTYTKSSLGLGNVNNTADADKSVKYATSAGSAAKLSSSAGSSTQPVYFANGKPTAIGYTINKSVPSDAKFTDTTYPLVTASVDGLMRKADKSKLDGLYEVKTFTKSLTVNTDWTDTGITGTHLDTGTYVVRVEVPTISTIGLYNESWSGIMSWFSSTTNNYASDEILLHNAGHADNSGEIYLRTIRTIGNGTMKLQIASKDKFPSALNVVFKFRRLV